MHQVASEKPPHVAMEESIDNGRVRIALLIRMAMVLTMMDRPPKRAFLKSRAAGRSQKELKPSRRLERPVRTISVQADRDAETRDPGQYQNPQEIPPRELDERNRDESQVNEN